jgi:4-amino-4-deoxy-L-arabinose transferase-like glycosyltransferase
LALIPRNHRIYPLLAALAGLVMVVRLGSSVGVFSATTDEPCHIGAAVSMVEAHKLVALVSHPPLARWVVAVPLWMDGGRLPECRGMTTIGKEDLGYALGTKVLYHSPTPARTMLIQARLAMLVFPVAALFFLWLLGRYLADGLVAATAVIFFSTDPTLLGHGFWICTDAAACAAYLAAIYFGVRWLRGPNWRTAVYVGLAIGLAGATKFSCLIAIAALAGVAIFLPKGERRGAYKKWLRELPLAAVVGFVAIWATYLFNLAPLGDQDVLGHPAAFNRIPAWIMKTPVPMPSFWLGIARLEAHNHFGQGSYLNGQVLSAGWWYYFPELLVLKSPVSFLVAFFLGLGLWVFRKEWGLPAVVTLVPAGVFLFIAMMGKIDIGIRHVLPVVPLLYLFAAWQLARPRWVWVLAILIAGAGIETAVVHPDYLSFFNFAAGGGAEGERYAVDSNLDWNQDVYRLADWLKAHANGRHYSIRLNNRRNKPMLASAGLDPDALGRPPHGTLLCIAKSVRLLDGKLPWLKNYRPIATVGDSIDIYDLTGARRGADEAEDEIRADDPSTRPQ